MQPMNRRLRPPVAAGLAATLAAAALLGAVVGGCGGDDAAPTPPPAACSITNVSTGLQTSFLSNEEIPISWDHTGSAPYVSIELVADGAVVQVISASTYNDGVRLWPADIGDAPSRDDYGIVVTALDEDGCSGRIDGIAITNVGGCTITPAPVVSGPGATTDTLMAGDAYTIEFDAVRSSGLLDIELWYDPPQVDAEYVGYIALDAPADQPCVWDPVDSFNYKPTTVSHNYYKFKFVDRAVDGCEAWSNAFRIVDNDVCITTVSGIAENAHLVSNSFVAVDLGQSGGAGTVDLVLYASGALVTQIAYDVPTVPGYQWKVDDYGYTGSNGSYQIKAIDTADMSCVGYSFKFYID